MCAGNCSCNCDQSSNQCVPESYTSCMVYDGNSFSCPSLAVIKPNCTSLNSLLKTFGDSICGILSGRLVLEIGAWDMDTLATLNVAHGLTAAEFASITDVSVLISEDSGVTKYSLETTVGAAFNGSVGVNATNVVLTRVAAGIFDAAGYSGAVANRGIIVINYTKD